MLKECSRCDLVYYECALACFTFRVYSGIVPASLEYILVISGYYQRYSRIFKECPRCALENSECILVSSTFRVYSGIVRVIFE